MRLRYTRPALSDIEEILGYVATKSPQGAERVHRRIQSVLELLLIHPRIGAQTDDPAIRRVSTVPYPYLIFYEARVDEVVIHAVRHAARDPSEMPGIPKR